MQSKLLMEKYRADQAKGKSNVGMVTTTARITGGCQLVIYQKCAISSVQWLNVISGMQSPGRRESG